MSIGFEPGRVGRVETANRFVHSATLECMAGETGEVTERLLKRYGLLARGGVGLIIPGAMYVHPVGRVSKWQTGIYSDDLLPGLTRLVDTIHEYDAKVMFQIAHSGSQTTRENAGSTPIAPSSWRRDPVFLVKPREMNDDDILGTIEAFVNASVRAARAGVDGVQIHAAHGVLINQFLSPFYNRRNDRWGGSEENRFRFIKEVVLGVKKAVSPDFPVLVKLNSNDYTPQDGITPELAKRYAGRLAETGVDAVEVSCGTGSYSNMNIWRGEVPVDELVGGMPYWKKPIGWAILKRMSGKYDLEEGYNLQAARIIKPAMGDTPLILVGGLRGLSRMEEILEKRHAEFVSMSRPLIREPNLVRKFKEGKSDEATCVSCNRCLAASVNGMEVRCYYRPKERRGGKSAGTHPAMK